MVYQKKSLEGILGKQAVCRKKNLCRILIDRHKTNQKSGMNPLPEKAFMLSSFALHPILTTRVRHNCLHIKKRRASDVDRPQGLEPLQIYTRMMKN